MIEIDGGRLADAPGLLIVAAEIEGNEGFGGALPRPVECVRKRHAEAVSLGEWLVVPRIQQSEVKDVAAIEEASGNDLGIADMEGVETTLIFRRSQGDIGYDLAAPDITVMDDVIADLPGNHVRAREDMLDATLDDDRRGVFVKPADERLRRSRHDGECWTRGPRRANQPDGKREERCDHGGEI